MTAQLLFATALAGCGLLSQAQTNNPNFSDRKSSPSAAGTAPPKDALNSRTLFLRNCAHCHGATGHGDDGPDLHDLGLSDDRIARRIRQGKAGQMTAFAGKLTPDEINALVAYVQSLK